MPAMDSFLVGRLLLFALVLARTGGLVMTAPIFGYRAIPLRVRVLLALALSLLVTSVWLGTSLPPIEDWTGFGLLVANELLVGALLGVGVSLLLAGVQVAGQIVSQLSGISFGELFNPELGENVSPISQLFTMLTLAVFVALGGHRLMTEALLDTFVWAPPGYANLGASYVDILVGIVTQSFSLGIRAAAPIALALLLSTLVLSLVSRTLPQLGHFAVGASVNSLVLLGMLFVAVGAVTWTFEEPLLQVLVTVRDSLRS
jgi:flagellar biosynthetic protein FliR